MRELSKNDWRVLAQLLEMASNEFSNHGCNDFLLENTPENFALVTAYEQWNCPEEPYPLNISEDGLSIYTMDSALMGFFASIARENAE